MKRWIYSETDQKRKHSNFYTTSFKRPVGHTKESKKNYYPGYFHVTQNHKKPSEETEMVDSISDDIEVVLKDLSTYKGSDVYQLALSLQQQLNEAYKYLKTGRGTGWQVIGYEDSIDAIEAYLDVAFNLEILEKAINIFKQKTGLQPLVDVFHAGGGIYIDYSGSFISKNHNFDYTEYDYGGEYPYENTTFRAYKSDLSDYSEHRSARFFEDVKNSPVKEILSRKEIFTYVNGEYSPSFVAKLMLDRYHRDSK